MVTAVVALLGCGGGEPNTIVSSSTSATSTPGAPEPDPGGSADEDVRQAVLYFESVGLPPGGLMGSMVGADRLIGGCIDHLGFPIENPDEGEVSGQYTFFVGEQRDRFQAVGDACRDALQELGVLFENSENSRRILFDALIDSHECLVENGYPSPGPPTFDSFTLGRDQWDPWSDLIGPGGHPYPDELSRSADSLKLYFASIESCPRP